MSISSSIGGLRPQPMSCCGKCFIYQNLKRGCTYLNAIRMRMYTNVSRSWYSCRLRFAYVLKPPVNTTIWWTAVSCNNDKTKDKKTFLTESKQQMLRNHNSAAFTRATNWAPTRSLDGIYQNHTIFSAREWKTHRFIMNAKNVFISNSNIFHKIIRLSLYFVVC